jgi:hypothetical protein
VIRRIKLLPLLIFPYLAIASPAHAQAPSLIQVGSDLDWAPYYMSAQGNIQSGQYVYSQLPNPSLAGNMILAIVPFDQAATAPTVTDNESDTYSLAATCTDTTNNEEVGIYYLLNAPAGVAQIKTTYNVTSLYEGMPAVSEWTNVATSSAFDGSSCGFANSTTVTGSSGVTPTSANDLVVQFAWNTYVGVGGGGGIGVHYTQGNQSNITWQQFLGTWAWAEGAQWGVYSSTSAFNPSMTVSAAGYLSLAVFFKSASAGTAMPSGIRIVARANYPFTPASPWNPNPLKAYFPCPATANLLVADFAGAYPQDLTGVSDSDGNTWQSDHALMVDSGDNTTVHNWSASNATASTAQSITLTFNSIDGADSIELYCIKGAATNAFDKSVAASGNSTGTGNFTSVSITPDTSDGLILMNGSQYSSTATGFLNGGIFEGCFWSGEGLSNGGCASNNAWGAYYNPNTANFTWTATEWQNSPVGIWAVETDAYEAAPASAPTPPTGLTATVH